MTEKPRFNRLVHVAVLLSLSSILLGFCGFSMMFWGSEIYQVTIPWAISIAASISAIALAAVGIRRIKEAGGKERGVGVAYASIVLGCLNFILPIWYWILY